MKGLYKAKLNAEQFNTAKKRTESNASKTPDIGA